MLSNIFQRITIYFRKLYISSLKSFVIRTDPIELKNETCIDLPDELRAKLDVYVKVYADFKNETDKEKQHWSDVVKETSGQSKDEVHRVYKALAHEPAKRQVNSCDAVMKKIDSNTQLYLVQFDKGLMSREAKHELLKLGFKSANLLEVVLFFQKYKDTINQYLPIITLDAYFDADKKIGLKKDDLYGVGIYSNSGSNKFGRIGELEGNEFYSGCSFMEGVNFLVKPI